MEKTTIPNKAVWLVFYKKKPAKYTINWEQAVEEALCLDWIESKKAIVEEDKRSLQSISCIWCKAIDGGRGL
ncbi:hypothetical protein GCM10011506_11800 [Marivirga lumbricoides]|uniref:Uncharacterized protein n=1 Tax=Marivirga lumbricoides TaxID=1046115 RepID=A0ABQ1LUV5_9BACT|nr:hypothetical protein GCM10011506_11800 [Marivirga lumbricoides]